MSPAPAAAEKSIKNAAEQRKIISKILKDSTMKPFPAKQGVPGFLFSGISSGIKKDGQKDLGLILSEVPCTAAGAFTKNRVKAAPVILCKQRLRNRTVQAVLVNSGNANACTGEQGFDDALNSCTRLASHLEIKDNLVVPCSTGVIGVPFPTSTIVKAVPDLVTTASKTGIPDFAESILTTDTRPKTAALRETVAGETIKTVGIAKGSGMIMPDMATMLAFIVCNVSIEKTLLSRLVKQTVEETFNRITVDGDMSTNDTVLVLAGGQAKTTITGKKSPLYTPFADMLHAVMKQLSHLIVKDGEGATKFITVRVVNGKTEGDARKAGLAVANSSLVKTAFFGEDFNWGRILSALGSSGARFDPDTVHISFNDVSAVENGMGVKKNIRALKKIVKKDSICVSIDLRQGSRTCEIATCDLSYEYVKINADYTT